MAKISLRESIIENSKVQDRESVKKLTQLQFEMRFEPLPGVNLSDSALLVLQALKNYCIAKSGQVPEGLEPVIQRLRDGKASRVDLRAVTALVRADLAKRSNESFNASLKAAFQDEFKPGDFFNNARFGLIAAVRNLLKEQGFPTTVAETLQDLFLPAANLPPTSKAASMNEEVGPSYELRVRLFDAYGRKTPLDELKLGRPYLVPIDGKGENAKARAELVARSLQFEFNNSRERGEDFVTETRLELHEKGSPEDAPPLKTWSYETK